MIDKNILIAKAQGITSAYTKMTESERNAAPRDSYGEDYNRLRQLIADQHPELEPVLPPPVTFETGGSSTWTKEPFAVINSYCEQITQMLTGINQ